LPARRAFFVRRRSTEIRGRFTLREMARIGSKARRQGARRVVWLVWMNDEQRGMAHPGVQAEGVGVFRRATALLAACVRRLHCAHSALTAE
jgi:hypothetical protein